MQENFWWKILQCKEELMIHRLEDFSTENTPMYRLLTLFASFTRRDYQSNGALIYGISILGVLKELLYKYACCAWQHNILTVVIVLGPRKKAHGLTHQVHPLIGS